MTTTLDAAAAGVLTAAAALVAGLSAPFAVLLAAGSAAAMTDAREHRIPNAVSAVAVISAACMWADAGMPLIALAAAAATAVSLHSLWSANLIGGGDVKYLPSLVLAAASLGDPVTALFRVLLFGMLLLAIATFWPGTSAKGEGPLVVGGPLALLLAVNI